MGYCEGNLISQQSLFFLFHHDRLTINKHFCTTPYGVWTPETDQAMELMRRAEHITLEGTYSAKVLYALQEDIKQGVRTDDDTLLLWNTYCGLDFSDLTDTVSYQDLPKEFHGYFKTNSNL